MSEEKSIKETLELLKALGLVAVTVKKIAADGKVNVDDLSSLIELGSKMSVLADGVSGAGDIISELKDLDQAEVLAIINELYKISGEINAN